MFRFIRQFRITAASAAALAVGIVLGLAGLLMLLGTIDEYRAGRAFNRAMDAYSASNIENVHAYLDEAIAAKDTYAAPQEVKGMLFIDEGHVRPARYAEAEELFRQLADAQENERHSDGHTGPSLPVLVGRAVAELEAARAQSTTDRPSASAVAAARRQLERAAEEYSHSGDLYINLATVALMEGNVPQCRRYLDKAREVSHVSLDGLPYLYNLRGLVELREGRLPVAVQEFEKVAEFRPDWSVPRLNLAAAYAQSLIRGQLSDHTAATYAGTIVKTVRNLTREHSPLVPPICHSLAVYNIRRNSPGLALQFFEQAAAQGELGWHAKLNRAIALYLAGKAASPKSPHRADFYVKATRDLQAALSNRLLTSRDKFAAYCILGTIQAQAGKNDEAIAHFCKAEDLASRTAIVAIRQQLPRIRRNLAGLYYLTDQGKEAIAYFEKSKEFPDPKLEAQAILRQLSTPPTIHKFEARLGKVYTDFDLAVRADVAAQATNVPLDATQGVRLILHNAITGEARPLPFLLEGTLLRTRVLNLPQGRFTCRLEVTDHLGNHTTATSEPFAIDREPPRFVDQDPAPGSTGKGPLRAITFRIADAVGEPDPATLSVMVRHPGATGAQRALVSRGRYRYAAPDGSTKANDPATADVVAPLEGPATAAGTYTVIVRANDALGKAAEATWSFTLK
ncbi:hypothetical protein HQ576_10755 [bacterium]|nr:hypothetical protein [bacterium]